MLFPMVIRPSIAPHVAKNRVAGVLSSLSSRDVRPMMKTGIRLFPSINAVAGHRGRERGRGREEGEYRGRSSIGKQRVSHGVASCHS